MNAKEQNIDVTVVCELKLKTEPQLSDKKIKAYFLTAGTDGCQQSYSCFLTKLPASIYFYHKEKNKDKTKGKKNNSFLH